ncbi:MAPK regulated corepressor interacting protein 2-like [Oratosquilla oratoria]|uniref:MAPK regulated corepressor interacting protein 2-like n=1 Tax=Oratosquilla oratoria TaxID=337810 RepID=UPI003F75BA68
MYNVSRGPTRIINRTRRDISQKLENLDQIRELIRKSPVTEDAQPPAMSNPRPTFQQQPGSGKNRASNGRTQEFISPQHEELIKFFHESWGKVCKELEMGRQNGHDSRGNGVIYYKDNGVHPALKNFEPFDLEAWWGNRFYQNVAQST